mmetsp:Transcript_22564/g.27193  ORF Transcript_22564/g.27193 Transcript_22564/m.27193 type:complete len:117 (-) Transcript_22564:865-1215(-)
MLTTTARIAAVRTVTRTPRVFSVLGGSRNFSLGDKLASKERVEEERYIKALEAERAAILKSKLRAEQAARSEEEAAKHHEEFIAPLMAEAEAMLKEQGETVNHSALESLAKWKYGY